MEKKCTRNGTEPGERSGVKWSEVDAMRAPPQIHEEKFYVHLHRDPDKDVGGSTLNSGSNLTPHKTWWCK